MDCAPVLLAPGRITHVGENTPARREVWSAESPEGGFGV
jgi:hypothetical protein